MKTKKTNLLPIGGSNTLTSLEEFEKLMTYFTKKSYIYLRLSDGWPSFSDKEREEFMSLQKLLESEDRVCGEMAIEVLSKKLKIYDYAEE